MRHTGRQHNISFRLLAWLLVISQALSSAAFADIKVFSKDTLAPQVVSQKSNPNMEVMSEAALRAAACSAAVHCLINGKAPEHVYTIIRDKIRNYPAALDRIDFSRSVIVQSGVVTIPAKNGIDEIRVCLKKDFDALEILGEGHFIIGRFALKMMRHRERNSVNEVAIASGPDTIAKFKKAVIDLYGKKNRILWASDMDDTLAVAGMPVSKKVADNIFEYIRYEPFAIITGVDFKQTENRILSEVVSRARNTDAETTLLNLMVASLGGSEIYRYNINEHRFVCILRTDLKEELGKHYDAAIDAINSIKEDTGKMLKKVMGWDDFKGAFISERDSQIAVSFLGRDASGDEKNLFKKRGSTAIRKEYARRLEEEFKKRNLPLEMTISGGSSIDITSKGINKGSAIDKIIKLLGGKREDYAVIFSGDELNKGENDNAVIEKADIILNVGKELDTPLSDRAYFSLPETGPFGISKFLDAYLGLKLSGNKDRKLLRVTCAGADDIFGKPETLKDLDQVIKPAIGKINAWSAAHRLGYRELPEQPHSLVRGIESHVRARIKAGVRDVLNIGIGGQYMTNKTLQDSLAPSLYNYFSKLRKGYPRIHMLGNIDPISLESYLKEHNLDPETTDICLDSKSGDTIESLVNSYFFVNWLVNGLGEERAMEHIVVLTNDKKPVSGRLGKFFEYKNVKRFYIPTADWDVGGRFSILAPVTLLSAAYAGIDIQKLLYGARDMKLSFGKLDPDNINRESVESNRALYMALYVYYNAVKNNKDLLVVSSFSEKLRSSADFLKQLFGESLGKDGKGVFPCIATGIDSVNDFINSPADKIFFFLNYMPESVQRPGQIGHPYINVDIEKMDERTFGQLVYLCEEFTLWSGALFGINPLVQPKVQLAKDITERSLAVRGISNKAGSIELSGENELVTASGLEKPAVEEAISYLDNYAGGPKKASSKHKRSAGKNISSALQDVVTENYRLAVDRVINKNALDYIVVGDRVSLLKLRAIYQSFATLMHNVSGYARGKLPRIHFIDETKENTIRELLPNLDISRTYVQFIGTYSKADIEKNSVMNRVAKYFKNDADNIIFGRKPLNTDIAEEMASCGLTDHEMMACAIFGLDIDDIYAYMNGYKNYPEALAKKLAAYSYLLYSIQAGEPKTVNELFSYSNQLGYFNSWVKSKYRTKFAELRYGPMFDAAIGSTDQHSILEPMLNWKRKIFTIFLKFEELRSDLTIEDEGTYATELVPPFMRGKTMGQLVDAMHFGVSKALSDDKRPNVTVSVPRLDPYNLGSLFGIFEEASTFERELLSRDVTVKVGPRVTGRASALGAEPLIGHGFADAELDKVAITTWSESEAFSKTLTELEEIIKARAPDKMKQKLLDTLNLFKTGQDGRRLGTVQSRYDSYEKYYLGFGNAKSIALTAEFFDPGSPLYNYRFEALFHELFHAAFGRMEEYSGSHDTSTHFLAIQTAAVIFWGLSENDVKDLITLADLENHAKNKFGEEIRNWKTDRYWEEAKGRIGQAIADEDLDFLAKTLRYLLKKPDRNSQKIIELFTIWGDVYRRSNGGKQNVREFVTRVTTELDKEEKYKLANLICSPEYHALYDSNPIINYILVESRNDISRQVVEHKVKEVAGRVNKNMAYLWDRQMRPLREKALTMLNDTENVKKPEIDELEKAYNQYMAGGVDAAARERAQKLKERLNLKDNEVICYDSMEYATNETLLFFAGGLGALAGDHAKAGSDLLPAGAFVCVGGYYKFGYLSQVIDKSNYQQAKYERMKIEEWGEIVKDADGKDIVVELPMPDGNIIYAKAWKIEMGRTGLYLMTTDIDENSGNPHYRDYLNYTYDANDERRIVQEYVIGVGGERLLSRLGVKTKILHLNEGHVAFTILEKARGLLMEKITGLNNRTGLTYKIENLEHIALEDRKKYGLTLEQALDAVRRMVVFTSHTPIADGNQKFPYHIAERYLGAYLKTFGASFSDIAFEPNVHDGVFDMTEFALTHSNLFNGVSRKHAEVCRNMYVWSNAKILERFKRNRPEATNVTNAVNREYYQPEEMQELLGRKLGDLQQNKTIEKEVTLDNISWVDMWKVANSITDDEMEDVSKRMLENGIRELKAIRSQDAPDGSRILPAQFDIDPDAFIIVFGRRMTGYKRPDFILDKDGEIDIEAWRAVVRQARSMGKNAQIIYTGKAHPADDPLKAKLQKILHIAQFDQELRGTILFIENYNTRVAKALVKIASAALNNPDWPLEASGTSGMKYKIGGKPDFSVMDGWYLEALMNGSLWGVYPFVTRRELRDIICGDWRFVNRSGESIKGRDIGTRIPTHEQETADGKKVFECLDPQCRHVWTVDEKDPDPSLCQKCGRPAIKYNSFSELGMMDVYFNNRARWHQIMRESLAMGLSYFTSHRMFMEYIEKMYIPTLESSEAAKKEFMNLGLNSPTADKNLKGAYAPESNPLISQLISEGKMVEISLEESGLKAYTLNYVDGYEPGITDPNRYRGPPVDIRDIFNEKEETEFLKYIEVRKVSGKTVKFRVAIDRAALGWDGDIDHSNIAHAGYRDGVVYIGKHLLKYMFQPGNEVLREEILERDEFRHLAGEDHGTDAEYKARLAMVSTVIRNLDQDTLGIADNGLFISAVKTDIDAINEARSRIDRMNEFPDPKGPGMTPYKRVVMLINGGESPGVNSYFALQAAEYAKKGQSVEVVRYGLGNLSEDKDTFERSRVWVNRYEARSIVHMPGAAWGTARVDIDDKRMPNIIDNLKGYCETVVIIGGNDHTLQAAKLAAELKKRELNIIVIALPKTIDRDTVVYPVGAHTAGAVLRDMVRRAKAPRLSGRVAVVEAMGRAMGYLTATSADLDDPSVFCAVPEWSANKGVKLADIVEAVKARREKYGAATVIVSEGFSVDPNDPLLMKILAVDKVLEYKYNLVVKGDSVKKILPRVDVHGNPFLHELGISDFVAKSFELELGLRPGVNLTVDNSGYSYRDVSPDDIDRKIAERATQLVTEWTTDRAKRSQLLEMGGACIAADANLSSADDAVSTMMVRQFEEGRSIGTISLDTGITSVYTPEQLRAMPILGLRVKADEALPDMEPAAAEATPVDTIDFDFAIKLIGSQTESARGMKRTNICVIDRPYADRFFDKLSDIVSDPAGMRAGLTADILFSIQRNADNIIIVKQNDRRSFSELAEHIAAVEKKKEGATLVISRDYLVAADDQLLVSLIEKNEALNKLAGETEKIMRDGIEYYNFGRQLAEIFFIALSEEYKIHGVRKNVLNRTILHQEASDARIDENDRKTVSAEGRFDDYSHMDEEKFVRLLERGLKRKLSDSENIKASEIIRKSREIREALQPAAVLNKMLAKGGNPELCITASRQLSGMFTQEAVPFMKLGKSAFLTYRDEYSTLYPFNEKVRHLWWDFDEGDTPLHVYIVFNFLGIPFILDLTADQFVMDLKTDKFVDIGIVIIPVKDLLKHDWPYVGGDLTFVLGAEQRKLLLGILNNDSAAFRILTGESAGPEQLISNTEHSDIMEEIHKLNLDLLPPVEKGKTLYHVIPIDLIPQSPDDNQRAKFVKFVYDFNRNYPECREKIEIVTDRQDLADRVRKLAADPNNIVDVALSSETSIENMPDVPMLVFEPENGELGDFRQLEGILAALRALHITDYSERIAALSAIHKLMTGKEPPVIPTADVSLKEFAKIFKFILPPITIRDPKELKSLNNNLLRLIESA